MSHKGRFLAEKPAKKTNGKKIAIITVCILLALIVVAGISVFLFVNSKLNKINKAEYSDYVDPTIDQPVGYFEDDDETLPVKATQETEATEATTEETEPDYGKTGKIINILLIGQDSRPGEDSKLADSIILATVNKEDKTLTLTSFLRDTFLKMPDYKGHTCGKNRINVNYALGYQWGGDLGAMEMLDLCIQNNFGVEIDGNVEVSFVAFVELMQTLGGVDVELDEEEAAYLNGEEFDDQPDTVFTAGTNHLLGWSALSYARMRHSSNGDSDIRRASRQRVIIGKLVDKIKGLNIIQMNYLLDLVLPEVITDIDKSDIYEYAVELLPLLPSLTIVNNQCPVEGSAHGEMKDIYNDGNESGVLVPDVEWNRRVLMEICEG